MKGLFAAFLLTMMISAGAVAQDSAATVESGATQPTMMQEADLPPVFQDGVSRAWVQGAGFWAERATHQRVQFRV